jgi:Predicted membrane protein
LTAAKVNAGDSSLRISATVSHNMTALVKADIGFDGEMGKESMNWIENRFKLPAEFSVRPPLSIPEAHLTWKKDSGISFISNLAFQDGPGISFDMFLDTEGLKINNILIQDAETNASFACVLKEEVIDFSFTGNLSHTTTDKIFHNTPFSKEWIKGDFQAHILLDQPKHSLFHGILEGGDFSFPWIQKVPLSINDISLRADNKSVSVDSLRLTWEDNHLSVDGGVTISENGFLFDLVMSADGLNWDTIRETLDIGDKKQDKNEENKKKEEDGDESEEIHFWELPVKGILRLDAESFTFDQYTCEPVQAKISFDPDCISIDVIDANVCGIFCPGVLEVTSQDISLDFQLQSRNQELSTTIQCFGDKKDFITGELDLEAQVMARGASKELFKSLNGNFEGTATNGKISRFGLLAKIFAFLNLTETFRGKLPGITKEGFPYKSMTLNGGIQNGLFMINEYVLDAPSMEVTSHGTVDIFANELDLEVLVSPFKTVDFIIKKCQ